MLAEQTGINKHAIKLVDGKQLFYRLIYRLGLIKLEIFKTNIKPNLANSVIQPSKSLTDTLILFIYQSNSKLLLYVDSQS